MATGGLHVSPQHRSPPCSALSDPDSMPPHDSYPLPSCLATAAPHPLQPPAARYSIPSISRLGPTRSPSIPLIRPPSSPNVACAAPLAAMPRRNLPEFCVTAGETQPPRVDDHYSCPASPLAPRVPCRRIKLAPPCSHRHLSGTMHLSSCRPHFHPRRHRRLRWRRTATTLSTETPAPIIADAPPQSAHPASTPSLRFDLPWHRPARCHLRPFAPSGDLHSPTDRSHPILYAPSPPLPISATLVSLCLW